MQKNQPQNYVVQIELSNFAPLNMSLSGVFAYLDDAKLRNIFIMRNFTHL